MWKPGDQREAALAGDATPAEARPVTFQPPALSQASGVQRRGTLVLAVRHLSGQSRGKLEDELHSTRRQMTSTLQESETTTLLSTEHVTGLNRANICGVLIACQVPCVWVNS